MCEFKDKKSNCEADNNKLNITTIETGDVGVDQLDLHKDTKYYENALELTTFGKFNYILIFICGLVLSNVLLETLAISFVLPVSECEMTLTVYQRGIMSAIGFVGIISSSHLWGFLADTKGRRTVIRPTLLFGFVFTVLSSFSTNFWSLVIFRFLNGICISGGSATIYAYLGEFHTEKNRSRAIMGSAFIFGVGATLMPAIAWLVINQEWSITIQIMNMTYKPWRLFMVVCGIPGLICGLSLFKIPESPKFLLSQGHEEKCIEILKDIYHFNTGNSKDKFLIDHVVEDMDQTARLSVQINKNENAVTALLRSMWSQTQPLFNRQYALTTTLICTIQFWTFVTSNGMYMWFPDILNSVADFTKEHPDTNIYICKVVSERHQHLVSSDALPLNATKQCHEKLDVSTYQRSLVLEVLYAVGFAFIGMIITKISKRHILFICLAGCGLCGIVVPLIDLPTVALYMYLILLLCGLGVNVLNSSTVDLYPTKLRAMAVCISLMMGRLGSVAGANIAGALIVEHCEFTFMASGVSLILAGILGYLIPRAPQRNLTLKRERRDSIVSMTGN